jgi:crotonobetainyl-CoA:carnitine CoA-transferase CaiB-like acyl-CoA transferase
LVIFYHGGNILPGVLSGIRVIDLTRMLAGPFCAVLLRELGARVIKVEFGESGDVVRTMSPITGGGESDLFMTVNRSNKSVMLDLKNREAQKVALDLIANSDILVENFARGVMKKLGLGYKAAREVNPKLIYCSMSGFGQEGPSTNLLAFDVVARTMGGLMRVTGFPDSPHARRGSSVTDMGGGLYALVAVMAALNHRSRTGKGQHIDISMRECVQAMTTFEAGGAYITRNRMSGTIDNQYQNSVHWNTHEARTAT